MLSRQELELVERALNEAEGKMSIPLLVSWGMPERGARSLVESWELRGWLRQDPARQNARYITPKLMEILSNSQSGQTVSSTVKLVRRKNMHTTMAILNQKGGVGKTTTAVTLASGLARNGYRVLLIDLDTQGNVADSLGLPHGDDLRRLLSPDLRCPLDQVITSSGLDRLDVIRSDKSTTALKQTLAGVTLREYILADVLESAAYDVILLDCAPSADLLHFAALVAADYLLIPTRLDKLAVNGVRDALQTLAALKRISHCQVAGILPTFYERVTLESHEQLIHLAQTFGKLVLPPIPQDTQCRVASRYGKTLWEYSPQAKALTRLRTRQPASGWISTSLRTSKGMAMKNDTNGFTSFDNLPWY